MNKRTDHPDFTSNYVQFNVALNGKHLFRTDSNVMGFDVIGVREVLAEKFPAAEGYSITRSLRTNGSTSETIAN